jgi:hypothetical protein
MHKDESICRKASLSGKHKDNSMHKRKSIWSIAIRSSIVPLLRLIGFLLLLPLRVNTILCCALCCVPGGAWIAAIYFAQRSYKASYQQMAYGQGVKVGFLTSFFTALWASLLFSGLIAWFGEEFIPTLTLYDSLWLVLIVLVVFMALLMIGTLISVILSWFLRTKNNQRP